jgi:hypothetical protein
MVFLLYAQIRLFSTACAYLDFPFVLACHGKTQAADERTPRMQAVNERTDLNIAKMVLYYPLEIQLQKTG